MNFFYLFNFVSLKQDCLHFLRAKKTCRDIISTSSNIFFFFFLVFAKKGTYYFYCALVAAGAET